MIHRRRLLVSPGLLALALLALPATGAAQGARQGLLSLDDARIFYEVVGSGEPIVVVHGGPGLDHAYLQPGLDALGRRNTLVYYDQRGTGRSAAQLDESAISFDLFVEDIDQLRQALGYEEISVLGHSFGTLLAIEYARRYPDRTRALILMNPVEPGTRFQQETADRQAERRDEEMAAEMENLRASEGFQARDPATLSRFYRLAFQPIMKDPERVGELDLDLAETTARQGQDVARLLGMSLGEVEWWDRLSSIEAPTLVLHGRHDAPPTDMARELAEAFPLGTFEVLDAGHFPYLEDRDGLLSAVSSFFATLR
ncbi:MAG: alpha/beta fold hydrolase [Gemmatimonadetes bacterium]|nr:alpha/beta fold hydrolase [Gemmatimonadota bacterium]